MRRRDCGLRERHVLLDLIGPMGEAGDIGEDAGVGGVSAVSAITVTQLYFWEVPKPGIPWLMSLCKPCRQARAS